MRGAAACSYFGAFASSSGCKQEQYHCCARYCAASTDAEHLLALLDSKTAHPSFLTGRQRAAATPRACRWCLYCWATKLLNPTDRAPTRQNNHDARNERPLLRRARRRGLRGARPRAEPAAAAAAAADAPREAREVVPADPPGPLKTADPADGAPRDDGPQRRAARRRRRRVRRGAVAHGARRARGVPDAPLDAAGAARADCVRAESIKGEARRGAAAARARAPGGGAPGRSRSCTI